VKKSYPHCTIPLIINIWIKQENERVGNKINRWATLYVDLYHQPRSLSIRFYQYPMELKMNCSPYRHTCIACRIRIRLELQSNLNKNVTPLGYKYASPCFSSIILGNRYTAAILGPGR
jgi:hypothetical protein